MIIVIKIGSSSVVKTANIKRIAKQVSALLKKHKQVIIVSSGAIALGSEKNPRLIEEKQAAAAVGQSRLMRQWEKAFERYRVPVGQILLTSDVFSDTVKRQNAFNTISTLLKHGAVPIVNENDTVAVDEIRVGDNDNLSAMVAVLMKAGLLINLTDVDGFYVKDQSGGILKLDLVEEIDEKIKAAATLSDKKHGTGGMITKLQSAKVCKAAGIVMVIAHAVKADLLKIAAGEKIGTRFI
ncbi:glutamate 5-kinase [candidate division WOR-1 bacterium RIFOXYA12_FULL_43_27]|uniref:Glutamate 5-kinase n=1 Tax=candidate division WOR-1 bacterium RIFOXYC2_FULL_46_14 TaxID=1802587 RepID=A0A1F4U7A6_UNCSA|nr:MAG: glutamate 5-kinase [candidate division WOR-1 bacterium RIFOXYA12_FULL_43_27]OGC19254.1 MAG: glutamate 5-kinase [candidate division WOR-1 bacterium RIFOXYB2_FULL_46_45]OGC30243.1 MAG: glutamate 5-kinase [candidate division WOR-1 bacterium RIFOXYA2_FULL_46_56]OGC40844.1 MAG: glutamate 5-kinase [candidate division WOR-1 bacterium RIFOXYC2_FULL_46_14]